VESVEAATTLHLDIAGRSLGVEAQDDAAATALAPAFAPLAPGPGAGGRDGDGVTVRAWCGDEHPHPLWSATPAGPMRLGAHGLAVVRPAPPAVELFTPDVGIELWGTRAAYASGDLRAHPASTAIATWLATTGALMLHAGAVAFDGHVVLVVGGGGAGKSTATLAAALAGADFLGDDLCVVEAGHDREPARVAALYATAKVNADTEARLGLEPWPSLGVTPKGKRVLAVGERVRIGRTGPVASLVVLRPPHTAAPTPVRLGVAAATRALAPTALKVALGAGSLDDWFALARHLARSVPAYELAAGWDIPQLVGALTSTIGIDA
jgi:hypothetical protein